MTPLDFQRKPGGPTCNVNQKFNFTIGGVALAVAAIVSYVVFAFLR